MTDQALPRPLTGVRVLDFSTTIAGPHCARLMADMGAEVIKVESPEGDLMRSRPVQRDGAGTMFGQLNAGKRSIVLDLKQPEAVVYARENGHRKLVALEYVVLRKDWERVHGANAHRPWLYGHRFNLTHAGNRYGLPAFYSLHAWIWKDNPAGRFAMWNPDVHCACCPG